MASKPKNVLVMPSRRKPWINFTDSKHAISGKAFFAVSGRSFFGQAFLLFSEFAFECVRGGEKEKEIKKEEKDREVKK